MSINGYSKDLFDKSPVDVQLGMLFELCQDILIRLDEHPTTCKDTFFAMEKDIKKLSNWRLVNSVVSICAAIGVSMGVTLAIIKGWAPVIKM